MFRYYEAVIEDMSEDQEQVTVKLVHNGLTEVTAPAFIRPITKPTVKKKTEPDQRHRYQLFYPSSIPVIDSELSFVCPQETNSEPKGVSKEEETEETNEVQTTGGRKRDREE